MSEISTKLEIEKTEQIASLRQSSTTMLVRVGAFPPAIIPEYYGQRNDELEDLVSDLNEEVLEATNPSRVERAVYSSSELSLKKPNSEEWVVFSYDDFTILGRTDTEISDVEELKKRYESKARLTHHLVLATPSIGSPEWEGTIVGNIFSDVARADMQDMLYSAAVLGRWSSQDYKDALISLDKRLMTGSSDEEEVSVIRDNWLAYGKLLGKYTLDRLAIARTYDSESL